jgi:hypothetical protein
MLTDLELEEIQEWAGCLPPKINLKNKTDVSGLHEPPRNLPWPIRKCIELIIQRLPELSSERKEAFVRCAVLKTAKWAIDGRTTAPSAAQFRNKFFANIGEMVADMRILQDAVWGSTMKLRRRRSPVSRCLTRSAIGLETEPWLKGKRARLILTSPPYPGTHVLYHRWQINGGKETPTPFWIINSNDGMGESYYTLGSRREPGLETYFNQLREVFISLHSVIAKGGRLVQLVSFSDYEQQLPRFLQCLDDASFSECGLGLNEDVQVRLWRGVPNRRWYTGLNAQSSIRREVLLIHEPL